jgi:hypothetical protein
VRALAEKEGLARTVPDIGEAYPAGLVEHPVLGGGGEFAVEERQGAAVAAIARLAVEPARPGKVGEDKLNIGPISRISGQRIRRADQPRDDLSERGVWSTGEIVAVIAIIPAPVQVLLLEVGEEFHPERRAAGEVAFAGIDRDEARREAAPRVVVMERRQGELFQVVGALEAIGRLTAAEHGRQQQADQHGDDRDDDQQLDQRERTARAAHGGASQIFTVPSVPGEARSLPSGW